jgi:hypothetical protein
MQHLQQICHFRNWRLATDTAGNLTIDLNLPDAGSHRVNIIRRMDTGNMITLLFFTDICHESEIKDPEDLLKDNGRMNHGAFAIVNQRLVAMDTQLEQTANIEEIAAIIFHLASYADKLNKKFSWKGYGDGTIQVGAIMGGPQKRPPE